MVDERGIASNHLIVQSLHVRRWVKRQGGEERPNDANMYVRRGVFWGDQNFLHGHPLMVLDPSELTGLAFAHPQNNVIAHTIQHEMLSC